MLLSNLPKKFWRQMSLLEEPRMMIRKTKLIKMARRRRT